MRQSFFIDATETGVRELRFQTKGRRAGLHHRSGGSQGRARQWEKKAGKELRAYFAGRLRAFSVPCDLNGLTPFTRDVLAIIAKIPYGAVKSYGWVAERLGKPQATRAVGNALARNSIPIILPCHRVVRGNGSLGGYALGVKRKQELLELERKNRNRRQARNA